MAQIASDLAKENRNLQDLLDEVWNRHGFHGTEQISIRFDDLTKMSAILDSIRSHPPQHIANIPVESIDDLEKPHDGLPPTNGIRMWLSGGIRIIVRPSGTEPKMKCYIEVITTEAKEAQAQLELLRGPLRELLS